MGGKRKNQPGQGDLFAERALFPVRQRTETLAPLDVSLKIKTALGKALKEYPEPASIAAARMSEIIGRQITEAALYSYTAPTKPEHDIGIMRLKAFVRVTGATWLWDLIVEDEGLTVMEGEEAHLAQLGHLEHERQQLEARIRDLRRDLKKKPVDARRPRGR